jgi:hypothetical protein
VFDISEDTGKKIEKAKALVEFAEKELRSVAKGLKKRNQNWVSPFDDHNNHNSSEADNAHENNDDRQRHQDRTDTARQVCRVDYARHVPTSCASH